MAIDFSHEFHDEHTKDLYKLKLLTRLAPVRKMINPFLRGLLPLPVRKQTSQCVVTENLDNAAEHYQKHKWAFVENVFSPEFHADLKKFFPPRRYLGPVNSLHKGYDWIKVGGNNRMLFAPFNELLSTLDHLSSPEFSMRISKLTGIEGMASDNYLIVNKSHPGTYVIPHRDNIADDETRKHAVNIVFFIDGSGGHHSGGLSLTNDNEYKSIIFEPTNLVNSCLIYDMKEPFYHGFLPIEKNKFRHALIKNWQA